VSEALMSVMEGEVVTVKL